MPDFTKNKSTRKGEGSDVSVTPKAKVTIEKSVTKNLGDYNSCRVSVAITADVTPDKVVIGEINKTVQVLNELIDLELDTQLAEIEKK